MQVDEESKGQQATNLDIGCYENDSEDEREIREQEEGQKAITFTLNAAGTALGSAASTLLVCSCLNSQSLVKIMYAADWQEVGEATSTKISTKSDASAADKEPKVLLKLYALSGASPYYFALPDLEKLGGADSNLVINQLFG